MRKKVGIIFAVFLIMFSVTACTKEKPKTVKVPDLVGVGLKDSKEIFSELNLIPAYTYENNMEFDSGTILWTDPKAGEIVEEYTKISFAVALGK